MKEVLIKEYNNLEQLNIPYKQEENKFYVNFIQGAKLETSGNIEKRYIAKFTDLLHNKLIHESEINNNMWTKTNIQYFINWKVEVIDKETNNIVFEHCYNAENKRVYIHFESSAIGDTLAWFPIIEEFRKENKCKVVCSTFHNEWFEANYPEIEFVKPGTKVFDLYGMFTIGWFYDNKKVVYDRTPIDFKKYPLQQTATEILGMKYREVKPIVTTPNRKTDIKDKYVVIAPHASAHAKYWNYPGGWQTIIDYLNDKGYKVLMLTQEPLNDEWHDSKLGGTLTGVIDKTGDLPLEDRINDLYHCEFFIGLGSGLSWLAWACEKPVIMISGFSDPKSEFYTPYRVINKNVCNSCWNDPNLVFDKLDWAWCPRNKSFECSREISFDMVKEKIDICINDLKNK